MMVDGLMQRTAETGTVPEELKLVGEFHPGTVHEVLQHLSRQWGAHPPSRSEMRQRVLLALVKRCHDEGVPFRLLGRGSNLLVSDEGFHGAAVSLEQACGTVHLQAAPDGERLVTAGEQLMDKMNLESLLITRGKDGADLYSGQQSVHIPTVPEDEIVDPTGVGDAFRGGFLAGYARGFDWKLCGEIGSLAAVYCLEQRGPQSHNYTRKDFVERFRKHFDDGGKLDELL